ncbi:membrane protein insertase YidC [Flavobacterium sp. CBA20B-1]|uniref:membrane protein insertase YidC n=1 Tax=unclassified Flavobacterium TaxID=196869 RepID=UPI002225A6DB|nr:MULTISPECIES: membrane protein insertase YidC [unclassified Flavobacterium]WCM42463.1 membrane protein insertase YidC [Flavobacterium sp. CBA20B-1]
MEEKKLDKSSLIGMAIITVLLIWMVSGNMFSDKKDNKTKEATTTETAAKTPIDQLAANAQNDSVATAQLKNELGSFAYGAALPTVVGAKDITVNNGVLTVVFSGKGGYIKEVTVNDQKRISSQNTDLVKIITDNNSKLNLKFNTKDNRVLNTKDLFFEPTQTKEGENTVISMKLKTSETAYLEYRYVLKPNDYMLDLSIKSVGLSNVLNTANPAELTWQLKATRNEKSITYENRYAEIVYEYEDGKDDYLNPAKTTTEDAQDLTYVAFKQHLFTSVLLTETPIKTAKLSQENLVKDEDNNAAFLKDFQAVMPLEYKGGELSYNMNLYMGPTDYNILNDYDKNLDEIVPLGWGIFGWLNKLIIIPIFTVLTNLIPHGIAIVLFTIVIRLIMSPVQYKSYVSQAKMKLIRPEVNELNEKYAKDPMKKQQETMKLYNKAGVNPMAGCIPMFIQLPVFYALFSFFPSAFDLRQKAFLWADDLSSYDSVFTLPFSIPFYGNHVSLFPILAALATFVYMKMTTGDQAAMTPQQEGMPDMSKIMKVMIYISPVMMLFFFNNYASGLSLYYFISNLITIGIMYVIKNKIVTEDKVKAIIETNKSKEKPKSKFQRKMEEMMEQAQQQQNAQKKK